MWQRIAARALGVAEKSVLGSAWPVKIRGARGRGPATVTTDKYLTFFMISRAVSFQLRI